MKQRTEAFVLLSWKTLSVVHEAEMYDYLIRIAKQPKKCVLTDVLLETLSIIAYLSR